MSTDRLGPQERLHAVNRLRATTPDLPLDIVVVGGGVVGCGAALDAAARGLSVGLLEMNDLASGTSSRSSRLAHGGLRYLEQREFGLVREALTERGLLLDRLAPHLVHPVPFLFPVGKRWQRSYVASGVRLYDALARRGSHGVPMERPRSLSRDDVAALVPDLRLDEVAGGVTYTDAQIDDARHTVAVARTAASFGALVATRIEVVGLLRGLSAGQDSVTGVRVHDRLTGAAFDVHARVIVGATGVWSDRFRFLLGERETQQDVRQSKGVHLIVPGDVFRSSTAVIARTESSVLFLLPWGGDWIIGTTDTDWHGDLADPAVEPADVDYLIGQANRWLARPIDRSDVIGVYAGLRPLVAAGDAEDETATLSREHAVFRPAPGLVQIVGGKYTTYRVMAADVVDAAVAELGREVAESRTADIPLVGAVGFATEWAQRAAIAADYGVPEETVTSLMRRHGSRATDVLALVAEAPDLSAPIVAGTPYLRAEVIHAATDEAALTVDDVLRRRTRAALESRDQGRSAAHDAAGLMAQPLGWSESQVQEAAETYLASPDALALATIDD